MLQRKIRMTAALASLTLAASAFAQANNNWQNATVVPGPGVYSGFTTGATNDGSASCGASGTSPDVWLRYTHTGPSKTLNVSLCNSGTSYDSVASIHSAGPGTSANQLACNDDGCGNTRSVVEATVSNGNTYYIRIAGFQGAVGNYQANITLIDPPPPPTNGPDVQVFSLHDINYYGTLGGIAAYAVGTTSCNRGDAPVQWTASNNLHPVIAQNMYRVRGGRFEQIGQSWLKHGFLSVNGNSCGTCVQPPGGGSQLGVNCSDPYGWSLNGSQGTDDLGPRQHVNATTGLFIFPFEAGQPSNGYIDPPSPSTLIDRRLQVATADVTPAQNVGARYFVEGHYVTQDDAAWNNGRNNVSYREINVSSATSTPSFNGATVQAQAAIYAWRAVHNDVVIIPAEYNVAGSRGNIAAQFLVGARVVNNGNGTWTYNYAIQNINSDLSGQAFTIPLDNVTISSGSQGFRDVPYHSGEPFAGTDWTITTSADSIRWATQTFAQNPNANALRWGTAYTFWFTANTAPTNGTATLSLFKSGGPASLNVNNLPMPSSGRCPADFNEDGSVDFFDYLDFVAAYDSENPSADFNNDGNIDFFDYLDFVSAFDVCTA
jgi:hypothetical protein